MANKKIQFAVPTTNMRTPTRSRFSFAGVPGSNPRMSLANPPSTSRPSMRQSMHTANNAPRDTSDKAVQQSMVRKIHEFLVEMDQEDAPSEKTIMKPTTKDFIIIFERIYETVAHDYEFGSSKLSEEIPRIISGLGYPYVIKHSTLQTIGASHSWHLLLHALAWLVDFARIQADIENCSSGVLLSGDEGNGNLLSYRYSWMATSYREISAQQGVVDEAYSIKKAAELHHWFETQEDYDTQVKNVNANLELLRRESKELENDADRASGLKDDILRVEEDIRKATDFNEQLMGLEMAATEELDNHSRQNTDAQFSVDELKEELDELKRKISDQAAGASRLTGSEARAIMTEHSQLKLQLRQNTADMEVLGRDHWKMQPIVNTQYTQLLSKYRKVMSDIRNVRTEIFGEATGLGVQSENPADIKEIQRLVRSDARGLLDSTTRELQEELQRFASDIEKIQAKISSLKTRHDVEAERLTEEERRYNRKALIFQRETETFSKERQQIASLIEELENSKETLEGEHKKVDDLKQELLNEQINLGRTEENCQRKCNEIETRVTEKITPIIEQLEAIKDNRKQMVYELNNLSGITEEKLQETATIRSQLMSLLL